MLEKLSDLDIPPEEPFKNDELGRKEIAENFTKLLKTISEPFVISISSPWGTGKTTFIKMWKTFLVNSENFIAFYYNAWENDFAEQPLISFIGELDEYIKRTKVPSKNLKSTFNKLKSSGASVLKVASPILINLLTHGAITNIEELVGAMPSGIEDNLVDSLKKLASDKIDQYLQQKKSIQNFKKYLTKFIVEIKKRNNDSYPVVFFIDEIDRCRPTFAIELLENIKHLFNIDGLIFILSIDHQQIISSLKSIYGETMDAEGYLRRFIDLEYKLPPPSYSKFSKFLCQKFNTENAFSRDISISELQRSFSILAERFNLSLRDQAQCFTQINLFFRLSHINEPINQTYLAFYTILNIKEFNLLKMFNEKTIGYEELIESLQKKYNLNDIFDYKDSKKLGKTILPILMRALKSDLEFSEFIHSFSQKATDESLNDEQKKYYTYITNLFKDFYYRYDFHLTLNKKMRFIENVNLR